MNERPADRLAIAVAQLNPIVGDVAGNLERARSARALAGKDKADVVAFSELFIAGYPPEDLVLKPAFQAACRAAVESLARETGDGGPAVLIGTPWVEDGKLYNAYAMLAGGRIETVRFKVNLPNYGVFDEKRVFAPGPVPGPVSFRGVRLGLPVCEDTWTDWGDYENVVETLAESGGEILIVPNGSPYWHNKSDVRLNVAVARVTESGLPLVYINQVGGQDELVFDGASFALNADRSIAFQLPAFRETVVTTQWSRTGGTWRCAQGPITAAEDPEQADYTACVLGLRDYVDKNRFKGVVLEAWYAAFAPPGTPTPIIAKLNAEMNIALKDGKLLENFTKGAVEPVGGDPDAIGNLARADSAKYAQLVTELNIHTN